MTGLYKGLNRRSSLLRVGEVLTKGFETGRDGGGRSGDAAWTI